MNQLDEQGRKQGLWKNTNEMNGGRYEANYIDGIAQGKYRSWHNGLNNTAWEGNFFNGAFHGLWKGFRPNNDLWTEELHIHGSLEGEHIEYSI